MHLLILIAFIALLVFGPQLWARNTFQRYAGPSDRIPGSGGELARHLLDRFDMQDVGVEVAVANLDHYDPASRTVRLSQRNYADHSLTAVAIAAQEVGHAIQHKQNDPKLLWRTRLVMLAQSAEKIGAGAMLIIPLAVALTRSPGAGLLMGVVGIFSLGSAALVHLITLPVELDASFSKALPVLQQGEYISKQDEKAVRRILKAAAYTYVAASLASLLNIWRWLAILRR